MVKTTTEAQAKKKNAAGWNIYKETPFHTSVRMIEGTSKSTEQMNNCEWKDNLFYPPML